MVTVEKIIINIIQKNEQNFLKSILSYLGLKLAFYLKKTPSKLSRALAHFRNSCFNPLLTNAKPTEKPGS